MPTAAYPARKRARIESREARLNRLGHRNYAAYLSSPEWRTVKARYRASDLPQDCGLCEESDGLDMHHMTYERVGQEELTDLIPLCHVCHRIVHVLEERGEIGLDFEGLVNYQRAIRYTAEGKARAERMSVLPDNAGEAKHTAAELRAKRDKTLVTVNKRKAEGKPCPVWATERLAKIDAELAEAEAGLDTYAF